MAGKSPNGICEPELSHEKVKSITIIISDVRMVGKKGAIACYSFFPSTLCWVLSSDLCTHSPFPSCLSFTWGNPLPPLRFNSDVPSSEKPSLTPLALMQHTLLYTPWGLAPILGFCLPHIVLWSYTSLSSALDEDYLQGLSWTADSSLCS